jgi:hypothetical protein
VIRRARPALLALILCGLAVAPGGASAGWSRPFDLSPPGTLDRLPVQLAVSPSGAATAAFSTTDVDTPGSAQAYVVTRTAQGLLGAPRTIPGAQEVLALIDRAGRPELLVGSSPSGLDCCSTVTAGRLGGASVLTASQTLVGGLTGASQGRLVTLAHGRTLAAVATEGGVWAAESGPGGRFAATHRLTARTAAAQALSAAALDGENAVLAWTAATGPAGYADPRAIFYALASHRRPPHAAHTLLRAPAGHRIDELVVAGRGREATAAWIDESFDRHGTDHTQVRAADFAARPSVRGFPAGDGIAAGLSLASDPAGAQALAYKTCRTDGGCTVRVTTRSPTSPFRAVVALGPIDAAQTPALSVSPRGRVIVGWIQGGHPVAAAGSAANGRFAAARSLSPTVYAYDVTVADGVRGAIAAWTQGTLNPSVVAAAYR